MTNGKPGTAADFYLNEDNENLNGRRDGGSSLFQAVRSVLAPAIRYRGKGPPKSLLFKDMSAKWYVWVPSPLDIFPH
jgi:hypothetical protein